MHAVITLSLNTVMALLSAQPPDPGLDSSPPATQKEQYVLVEGQVYNHTGSGVAGATVALNLKDEQKTFATVVTNDIGDYRILATEPINGPALLTFSRQYYNTVTREIALQKQKVPPFIDIEMTGSITVQGVVKDDQKDSPIKNATITVKSGYKEFNTLSDQQGQFAIEDLLPGSAEIIVETAKYARLRVRQRSIESLTEPLQIRLRPERIVDLLVTDEAGKPIKAVNVELLVEKDNDYRQMITDENGKLTVRGLDYANTTVTLRLTHEAFLSSSEFDRKLELPQEERTSQHTLIMHPACTIVGTIYSKLSDGEALGARVTGGATINDYSPRTWSAFDGTYELTGVSPGETVVTVHLAGHGPELATTTVKAKETGRIDFKLGPSRTVSGMVADDQGNPLAGAYVIASGWRGFNTLGIKAVTDQSGRFQLVDAPLDEFTLLIEAGGFQQLPNQVVTPSQSSEYAFTLIKAAPSSQTGDAGLKIGSDAPDFTIKTLDGKVFQLAQMKGKIVLIEFWATWCPPCFAEMPHLREVFDLFGKRSDFIMLGMAMDREPEAVKTFVQAQKMGWQHAVGPDVTPIADRFAVRGIPAIFIVGPDGKILATNLSGSNLKETLKKLLDAANTN